MKQMKDSGNVNRNEVLAELMALCDSLGLTMKLMKGSGNYNMVNMYTSGYRGHRIVGTYFPFSKKKSFYMRLAGEKTFSHAGVEPLEAVLLVKEEQARIEGRKFDLDRCLDKISKPVNHQEPALSVTKPPEGVRFYDGDIPPWDESLGEFTYDW